MVGTNALFDTNILIDYLKGVDAARLEMDQYKSRAISIVAWMEVMAGAGSAQEDQTRTFLASFKIYPITMAIAERAVGLRRLPRMKLPDALILATAELHDCLLVTRNTRDFSIDDPRIRVPYEL